VPIDRRSVEYECRNVCQPIRCCIPKSFAAGWTCFRMTVCPHRGCSPRARVRANTQSSGAGTLHLVRQFRTRQRRLFTAQTGTRLIGTLQILVTFHRPVSPDGFSLDFCKYICLDQIGGTGLANPVDNRYLMAFGGPQLSAVSAASPNRQQR
jgi:hypothetical protein